MKSAIIRLVVFLCLMSCPYVNAASEGKSCVRYVLSGGRFGDNLLAVAHAKWVSYSLGLPLMYSPFPYSDQLQISVDPSVVHGGCICISPYDDELQFSRTPYVFHLGCYKFFSNYVLRKQIDYLKFSRLVLSDISLERTLVTVPSFPESPHDFRRDPGFYNTNIEVDWDDPDFKEEIRNLLAPICTIPKLQFPEGYTTVALHIRSGAGFDEFDLQKVLPLKSPPLSYYMDALKLISSVSTKPLYVFVFTDDPHPERFKVFFGSVFSEKESVFECRMENNKHDLNVLEDFFAFSQFDCLICTYSYFSYVASKLFDYKMVVTPVDFKIGKFKKNIIDPISFQLKDPSMKRPLKMIFRKKDQPQLH